jgi:hypothetical protein
MNETLEQRALRIAEQTIASPRDGCIDDEYMRRGDWKPQVLEFARRLLAETGQGEPVAWIRTLDGEIDWAEDCLVSTKPDSDAPEQGYGWLPLYAALPPDHVAVPRGRLHQAARKLALIGQLYDGDKESRGLAAEFELLLAAHKEKT